MAPRFYSNWITYALYGSTSLRAFSLITLILYMFAILTTGFLLNQVLLSVALVLLLTNSPIVLSNLVRRKPEKVWWALAVPAFAASFHQSWEVTWIILGFLLTVNTSVACLVSAMLIAPLGLSVLSGTPLGGYSFLCILPGAIKQLLRVLNAYREGFLRNLNQDQSRLAKVEWGLSQGELVRLVEWLIFTMIASWTIWSVGVMMYMAILAIYYTNSRLIKIADFNSILRLVLSAIIAEALLSGSWLSVLGVVLYAYNNPFSEKQRSLGPEPQQVNERIRLYKEELRHYPWFAPIPLPKPDAMIRFLQQIADGSRILMECHGDPRTESRYRWFHDWTNEFLPMRHIEFVNQTFLIRVFEPSLADRYLSKFNASDLPPNLMNEICSKLGVSYVITYTKETGAALEHLGYSKLATARNAEFADLANCLRMPAHDLTLYASPEERGIIAPDAPLTRRRDAISWDAASGQEYTIRYRYHQNFIATQGMRQLHVHPESVFSDIPLRFMRISANNDGLINLRFVPRFL